MGPAARNSSKTRAAVVSAPEETPAAAPPALEGIQPPVVGGASAALSAALSALRAQGMVRRSTRASEPPLLAPPAPLSARARAWMPPIVSLMSCAPGSSTARASMAAMLATSSAPADPVSDAVSGAWGQPRGVVA